jgi:hypothetical protein
MLSCPVSGHASCHDWACLLATRSPERYAPGARCVPGPKQDTHGLRRDRPASQAFACRGRGMSAVRGWPRGGWSTTPSACGSCSANWATMPRLRWRRPMAGNGWPSCWRPRAELHLAHALRTKAIALAQMLRADLLPEAYIASRELSRAPDGSPAPSTLGSRRSPATPPTAPTLTPPLTARRSRGRAASLRTTLSGPSTAAPSLSEQRPGRLAWSLLSAIWGASQTRAPLSPTPLLVPVPRTTRALKGPSARSIGSRRACPTRSFTAGRAGRGVPSVTVTRRTPVAGSVKFAAGDRRRFLPARSLWFPSASRRKHVHGQGHHAQAA